MDRVACCNCVCKPTLAAFAVVALSVSSELYYDLYITETTAGRGKEREKERETESNEKLLE